MVIPFKRKPGSDSTGRYQDTGLDAAFLAEIFGVMESLKEAGFEPYDQLLGYVRTGNDQYITRRGNARAIVTGMDVKDIKVFLEYYKKE